MLPLEVVYIILELLRHENDFVTLPMCHLIEMLH